jgi:spermidine/putrescine transport system substrate-binding protein
MKTTFKTLLAFSLSLSLWACTKKSGSETGGTPPSEKATGERVVNLAIWGNYLSPEQEKIFKEKTGIKINITNYASNEELLAKLQAGATGYDVAVPSDYMVDIMIKTGLIEKLDKSQIPNQVEVSSDFLKQSYDPNNEYSLPYAWSMTGIAINRDLFKGTIKGWKDLLENKELDGKIALLDDVREVMGAALKINGFSYNSTKPEEIAKAKKTLLAARKHIKMFRSDLVDPLVNKEVAAAQAYMVDANQAWRKTSGKVDFIIPEEGPTFAIDNVVIIKGAPHPKEAHQLINFFLQPEINALFVRDILAGPVLTKTIDLLPADLKAKNLFPGKDVIRKSESIHDLGETTRLYDEAWTEIKSD